MCVARLLLLSKVVVVTNNQKLRESVKESVGVFSSLFWRKLRRGRKIKWSFFVSGRVTWNMNCLFVVGFL